MPSSTLATLPSLLSSHTPALPPANCLSTAQGAHPRTSALTSPRGWLSFHLTQVSAQRSEELLLTCHYRLCPTLCRVSMFTAPTTRPSEDNAPRASHFCASCKPGTNCPSLSCAVFPRTLVQQTAWEDQDSVPLEREQARFLSVNEDSASLHSTVLSFVTVSMGALHVAPWESGLRRRAQDNVLPWLLPLLCSRKFFSDQKPCTSDQHPGHCSRLQATSRVKSQTPRGS